jgi:hypothetical protein
MMPHKCTSLLTRSMAVALLLYVAASSADAQPAGQKWATAWAASVHGPYPAGNPTAQPELKFAFPSPEAGANDQTFRLIVRPGLWGERVRLRFSNAFGTKPVTFDGANVGLQATGASLVPGSNRPVTFDHGKRAATVAPGQSIYTDPVALDYSTTSGGLEGRKLAVSFHVGGATGPMTWHAKALQTSYVSPPGSGARGADEADEVFPFTTTSWYFLDAVDVIAPADTAVVVAFGDSITDGTGSTINGDDRYPDSLARRLHQAYGDRVVVVNADIGGNMVSAPAEYPGPTPWPGGPSAVSRLERDVLSLSGVTHMVWMEGINDLG